MVDPLALAHLGVLRSASPVFDPLTAAHLGRVDAQPTAAPYLRRVTASVVAFDRISAQLRPPGRGRCCP